MIEFGLNIFIWLLMLMLIGVGAFLNACLSYFLDFCISEGGIFEGWLLWLHDAGINEDSFWYNPLGGCVVCSNVWQGFITFWIFAACTGLLRFSVLQEFVLMAFYVIISNFLIRKMK